MRGFLALAVIGVGPHTPAALAVLAPLCLNDACKDRSRPETDTSETPEEIVSLLQQQFTLGRRQLAQQAEPAQPAQSARQAQQAQPTEAWQAPASGEPPLIKTNTEVADAFQEEQVQTVFQLEDQEELVRQAIERTSVGAAAEQRFWRTRQPIGRPLRDREKLLNRVAENWAEASMFDARNFSTGHLKLFNPSLIDVPPHWRRPGERWLAAFRFSSYKNNTGPAHEGQPKWHSSFIVLTTLDSQLYPMRPLRVLGSSSFFEGAFDCHLEVGDSTTLFGPEDGRLLLAPGDEESAGTAADPRVLLFWSGRAHSAEMAVPCSDRLGQRMFLSELGPDLRPRWSTPVLVPGERDLAEARSLNGSQAQPDLPPSRSPRHNFNAQHMQYIEKNWSPFFYRPQTVERAAELGSERQAWGKPMILAEYSLEPHVVVDIVASPDGTRAGSRYIWNTSSPAIAEWRKERQLEPSEVAHLSVAPVLLQRTGRPDVYLSALHVKPKGRYFTSLYMFEATPPFRVLGISSNVLPLMPRTSSWGGAVAFPMGLHLDLSPQNPELWIEWGRGDLESHRARIPWEEVDKLYLPPNRSATPGLTLVLMSHSQRRLPALLSILRPYRGLPAEFLEEIVLIFNEPEGAGTAPEIEALTSGPGVTVRVLFAKASSMNNRFAIWESIRTEGVIIQDDDVWLELPALAHLISTWRLNPDDLVGAATERGHFEVSSDGGFVELSPACGPSQEDATLPHCTFWGDEYSMLLPRPWVVKTAYLRTYMEGKAMTKLVDEMATCDDIYFNAVVANATGRPPVAADVQVHHLPHRSDVGSMLGSGGGALPLRRARCFEAVNRFYRGQQRNAEMGFVWHKGVIKKEDDAAYSGGNWRLHFAR